MVRVEQVKRPAKMSKRVELPEGLVLDVEREGATYTFKHERRAVGRVSGDFVEVCIYIRDNRVCFTRSELDSMLGGE
jgi:hypothetical protein